jgi:hypothetical protein
MADAVRAMKYGRWPVFSKLKLAERLMKEIGPKPPAVRTGVLVRPVEELTMTLAEHYGERAERFRAAAQGYVDDRLHEVFPPVRGEGLPLAAVIRKHRQRLVDTMTRWSGVREEDAAAIVSKLEERAEALGLRLQARRRETALMDLASMATAVALDYAYTGQLLA